MYRDYTNLLIDGGEAFIHPFLYGMISFVLFLYSLFSIYSGVFRLPGKRGRGIYHKGVSMDIILVTVFLLVLSFFIPILGYHLSKNNFHHKLKHNYN